MELFLELASTIVVTLLLCYFIGKLVSSSPNGDTTNNSDRRIRAHEFNFQVESAVRDSEIEERFETVQKVEGHEELPEDFYAEEFVNGSEIEEDNEEKEASKEKLVEQESHGKKGGFSWGERGNIGEIEMCSSNNEEMSVSKRECEEKGEDCVKEGFSFDEEEDDWVGIERTELERLFGEALVFVGSKSNSDKVLGIENDLKMKLYGLYKIATQGPCFEPQPMALKVSARAKWNAWQQLGEMTPEMAMEQYIWLLSENVPGWMRDGFNVQGKRETMKNLRLIIEGIGVIYVRVRTHQNKATRTTKISGAFVPAVSSSTRLTCSTTVDGLIANDDEMKEEGFKDS